MKPVIASLVLGLATLGATAPIASAQTAAQNAPNLVCVRNSGGYVARVLVERWGYAEDVQLGSRQLNVPQGWRAHDRATLIIDNQRCYRFPDTTRIRVTVEGEGMATGSTICSHEFNPARSVSITARGTIFGASCQVQG